MHSVYDQPLVVISKLTLKNIIFPKHSLENWDLQNLIKKYEH